MDRLEPNPLAGVACRRCGQQALYVELRLEAKPIGSFSLAGAQLKASANRWPWAVCGACGAASKGKREEPS